MGLTQLAQGEGAPSAQPHCAALRGSHAPPITLFSLQARSQPPARSEPHLRPSCTPWPAPVSFSPSWAFAAWQQRRRVSCAPCRCRRRCRRHCAAGCLAPEHPAVALARLRFLLPPPSADLPSTHLPRRADYSSLQPPAYTVTLSFNLSGTVLDPLPCVDLTNRACLPQVGANSGLVGAAVLICSARARKGQTCRC